MTAFHVDLDHVTLVVDRMAATHADLAALADRLDASSGRLHEAWTGLAASAHASAHAELAAGLASMGSALAELRVAADHAHGNYARAASANAGIWGELTP